MSKTLKSFLDNLNEKNVEITKPSAVDKWGLRIITPDGKTQTYGQLQDAAWKAAINEVVTWIRKNLNYEEFQPDLKPIDIVFKGDGTVDITSDKGQIKKYRLSSNVANKIAASARGGI